MVTLYSTPHADHLDAIVTAHPVLLDHSAIKSRFCLDRYYVDVTYNPMLTVESARYWISLFSHRRDGVWKGMLRIELDAPADDARAGEHLRSLA